MPAKDRKLIYELNEEERKAKLMPVLLEALQEAADLGLPFVYRNELCVRPNMFIQRYPDGRTLLIEQDSQTFTQRTIQILRS